MHRADRQKNLANGLTRKSSFVLLQVVFVLLAVSAQSTFAQTLCRELDHEACATAEFCNLDLNAFGTAYQCAVSVNRCEIGYRQHQSIAGVPQDDPSARCEARQLCDYVEAEQCYCPKTPGILCVCDGGRPHQCVDNDQVAAPPPKGDFKVVEIRRAVDVAGGPLPMDLNDAIGRSIGLFSDRLTMEGMTCENWIIQRTELLPQPNAPDLMDVFIGPAMVAHSAGDQRILQTWSYSCEGVDTFLLTQIDANVIILHLANGLAHAIAERKFSEAEIEGMQAALKGVKYYDGPINGKLTKATLAAAAFWAEERMREVDGPRYQRPALTQNLFDTMGVFE